MIRTRTLAAVAVVALLAVIGWFLIDALGPREPPSVAVLPLRNISDEPLESDYLAEGISQAVITRLVQAGLRVTPWDTARRYGHTGEPPEAIARELNTDTVLVGTFHLAEDRILASLSLVEADSGMLSWAEEFEAPYESIFQMQRQIAVRAATSLKRSLTGEEEEALTTPESQSVDAYDFYLQGAYLTQEGTPEATDIAFEYFTRAVELDPNLAEAHVGLGVVRPEACSTACEVTLVFRWDSSAFRTFLRPRWSNTFLIGLGQSKGLTDLFRRPALDIPQGDDLGLSWRHRLKCLLNHSGRFLRQERESLGRRDGIHLLGHIGQPFGGDPVKSSTGEVLILDRRASHPGAPFDVNRR